MSQYLFYATLHIYAQHSISSISIYVNTCPYSFPCVSQYLFCATLHIYSQIIVLENGKVIEQGPHEVLLSKAGRYAQLWGQQNNTVDALDSAVKLSP